MGIFKFILPKEVNFYKMLFEQAQTTSEGIEKLYDYMKTGDKDVAVKVGEMEVKADLKRRVLLDELDKTFITPFPREDIYSLSRAIDDIIDYGYSTLEEMEIFGIEPNEELKGMVEIIWEISKHLCLSVEYLENNTSISSEYALKVKALENKVERFYRNSLNELFKNDNLQYMLKMREIYRHLSNCADKGDLAADIIGHIIVKKN